MTKESSEGVTKEKSVDHNRKRIEKLSKANAVNEKLLARQAVYTRNFQAIVKHFRAFSSKNEGPDTGNGTLYGETESSYTVWPDEKFGPFSPQDKRFPLPGQVGAVGEPQKKRTVDPETLFKNLPSERHEAVLQRAMQVQADHEKEQMLTPSPADLLEFVAHECPQIMKKDFADLFPNRNIIFDDVTIVTVSQKTKKDMSGWSEEVEVEREELLKTFVEGATAVCEALQAAGFWADFIDPSSGKPFLGPYTCSTLFETDERYKKLGFEIDDLGCCKVIRHHVWGTHAYVGCFFTNAPTTEPIIANMMKT